MVLGLFMTFLVADAPVAKADRVLLQKTYQSGFVPVAHTRSMTCSVTKRKSKREKGEAEYFVVTAENFNGVKIESRKRIQISGELEKMISLAAAGEVAQQDIIIMDAPQETWTAFQRDKDGKLQPILLKAIAGQPTSNSGESVPTLIGILDRLCPQ